MTQRAHGGQTVSAAISRCGVHADGVPWAQCVVSRVCLWPAAVDESSPVHAAPDLARSPFVICRLARPLRSSATDMLRTACSTAQTSARASRSGKFSRRGPASDAHFSPRGQHSSDAPSIVTLPSPHSFYPSEDDPPRLRNSARNAVIATGPTRRAGHQSTPPPLHRP